MQTLKPEIEKAILLSAENLFYRYGFSDATMRNIAEGAGIQVSNLYLYFKNKKAIFSRVISPFAAELGKSFTEFFKHQDSQENIEVNGNVVTKLMSDIIIHNHKYFIILFEKSGGTEFEQFRDRFIRGITSHIGEQTQGQIDTSMQTLIAENLLNGFIYIAHHKKETNEITESIKIIFQYHMKGISSFI